MSTRGLIGFRYQGSDKLAYNHADSYPDVLGKRILEELKGVSDWGPVKERIGSLVPIPENRRIEEIDGMITAEIRRHFPTSKHQQNPSDCYDLFQPMQGSFKTIPRRTTHVHAGSQRLHL